MRCGEGDRSVFNNVFLRVSAFVTSSLADDSIERFSLARMRVSLVFGMRFAGRDVIDSSEPIACCIHDDDGNCSLLVTLVLEERGRVPAVERRSLPPDDDDVMYARRERGDIFDVVVVRFRGCVVVNRWCGDMDALREVG